MKPPVRFALIFVQCVVGIRGLLGARGLLMDPTGAGFGWSTAMLAETPFIDFALPGIALLGPIGLSSLAAAAFTWRRHPGAGALAVALGVFLVLFLVVEVWWVGLMSWLQPVFFVLGIAELALGLRLHLIMLREDEPDAL